jgi:hypothetical protein
MSAPTKRRKLSENQIAELIWDSKSDEAGASRESSSEDEGHFEDQLAASTCNRTSQHPVATLPAAKFLQVPLRKKKLLTAGQVNRYICHPPHGHAHLALGQV